MNARTDFSIRYRQDPGKALVTIPVIREQKEGRSLFHQAPILVQLLAEKGSVSR
jgi:hypothetical protein